MSCSPLWGADGAKPTLLHKQKSLAKQQGEGKQTTVLTRRHGVKFVLKLQTSIHSRVVLKWQWLETCSLLVLTSCTLINSEKHPFTFTIWFSQFPHRGIQVSSYLLMTKYIVVLQQQKQQSLIVYTPNIQNARHITLILSCRPFCVTHISIISKL